MDFGDGTGDSDVNRIEDSSSQYTQMQRFDDNSSMNSYNTDIRRVDDGGSQYSKGSATMFNRVDDAESDMQRVEEYGDDEDFKLPHNRDMDRMNGPITDVSKFRSSSNFVKGGFKMQPDNSMKDRQNTVNQQL